MNYNNRTLTPTDIPNVFVSGVMMFATQSIDGKLKRLAVEKFNDDSVDVINTDGKRLHLNRFDVLTPIAVCVACGKALELHTLPKSTDEYAECPDHARHMYESYYAAAHDIKKFNHTQRRDLERQAKHWLNAWMKTFARRNQNAEMG